MNNVNLMGRLCGEIELKRTQNGNVCTNFSLAVDRYANGNKTTDFIRCVAWGKTAENIGKFFHKGICLQFREISEPEALRTETAVSITLLRSM